MILAAITGSIGCGKTTLASLLRDMGFIVFDVDQWSRALYKEPVYLKKMAEVFPEVMEQGVVNKKKLRDLVFNNQEKLKLLEKVSHPFLRKRLKYEIHKNAKSSDLFFVDAALLFEAGWDKYCQCVVLADVDYETQKIRVMKRDGISAEEFEKINAQQMSNKEKALLSDLIIDTDKPLNLLKVDMMCLIDDIVG